MLEGQSYCHPNICLETPRRHCMPCIHDGKKLGSLRKEAKIREDRLCGAGCDHLSDQIDDAFGLHLFQHAGTVLGDGFFSNAQLRGDLF